VHATPEQLAEFARRDAAFMASYELRRKARETHDPEERKQFLREAEAQETIAYTTDD
jgi:hypothetical protein